MTINDFSLNRRTVVVGAGVLAAAATLTACGSGDDTESPTTGVTVTFTGLPSRVNSSAAARPGFTKIVAR